MSWRSGASGFTSAQGESAWRAWFAPVVCVGQQQSGSAAGGRPRRLPHPAQPCCSCGSPSAGRWFAPGRGRGETTKTSCPWRLLTQAQPAAGVVAPVHWLVRAREPEGVDGRGAVAVGHPVLHRPLLAAHQRRCKRSRSGCRQAWRDRRAQPGAALAAAEGRGQGGCGGDDRRCQEVTGAGTRLSTATPKAQLGPLAPGQPSPADQPCSQPCNQPCNQPLRRPTAGGAAQFQRARTASLRPAIQPRAPLDAALTAGGAS